MRLLLLTRRPTGYTARRLREAADGLGHRILALDPAGLGAHLGAGRPTLVRGNRPVPAVDGAHLRPGGRTAEHGLLLLRVLETAGVPCLNSTVALGQLRPRTLALAQLGLSRIPVLRGATVRRGRELEDAVAAAGGLPVVLHAESRDGRISRVGASSLAAARAALSVLLGVEQTVMVQAGAPRMTRVLVVGGRARGAVTRLATGRMRYVAEVGPETQLAARAARALGLDVAGVDVAALREGPAVASVTASPALEALEALGGVDLATPMVRAWAARVRAGA
ncbi:MAG: hypothetical protein AB2A00_26875 [Myxococcota bacterium]